MFGGKVGTLFPTQVGPPTDYARRRHLLLLGVVIYQGLMAAAALFEFFNLITGIIMIIGTLVGVEAWRENMNITYICWWGVISFVAFWCGLITAFIGFAIKLSTIVTKFNVPLSCFCGIVVAWWFFADYEEAYPCNDYFGVLMKQSGLLRKGPPSKAAAAGYGNAPNFGGFDSKGLAPAALGFSAGAANWQKPWQQLDSGQKLAAQHLGWSPDAWQEGQSKPLETVPWNQLSGQQQDQLKAFQLDANSWDKIATDAKGLAAGVGSYGALDQLGAIQGARKGNKNVASDPFMISRV